MDLHITKIDDQSFPAVISQENNDIDVIDWSQNSKDQIRSILNQYGAILFRGFNIQSVDDFEELAEATTSDEWVEYLEATSPRDPVKKNTATSTKYKNDRTIFFHNEKSYSRIWPHYLFFYCDVPSSTGGQTPLSDCRAIYKDIPDEIKARFEERRLMYVRRFSNNMGIPWKHAFAVDTEEELVEYCKENSIEDLTWNKDGTPVLRYVRGTSLTHPTTGEKCWFNHGTFFNMHSLEPELKDFFLNTFGPEGLPYNTFYGDGEEIEEEVILLLRELYEKHSTSFNWEKGDVLLIDNMLVSHGRRPFEGERNILVTMTQHVDYQNIEVS